MCLSVFQKTIFTKTSNGQVYPIDCRLLTPARDKEGVCQATGILIMDLALSSEALGKLLFRGLALSSIT